MGFINQLITGGPHLVPMVISMDVFWLVIVFYDGWNNKYGIFLGFVYIGIIESTKNHWMVGS